MAITDMSTYETQTGNVPSRDVSIRILVFCPSTVTDYETLENDSNETFVLLVTDFESLDSHPG